MGALQLVCMALTGAPASILCSRAILLDILWRVTLPPVQESLHRLHSWTSTLLLCGLLPEVGGCWVVNNAPIGVAVCASIPGAQSTSCPLLLLPLSLRPWYKPCWNQARNSLGALSAASKNWSVNVFSDFVNCHFSFMDPISRLQVGDARGSNVLAVCCKICCLFQPVECLTEAWGVRRCHVPVSGIAQGNLTAFVMIVLQWWSCRGLCRVASC